MAKKQGLKYFSSSSIYFSFPSPFSVVKRKTGAEKKKDSSAVVLSPFTCVQIKISSFLWWTAFLKRKIGWSVALENQWKTSSQRTGNLSVKSNLSEANTPRPSLLLLDNRHRLSGVIASSVDISWRTFFFFISLMDKWANVAGVVLVLFSPLWVPISLPVVPHPRQLDLTKLTVIRNRSSPKSSKFDQFVCLLLVSHFAILYSNAIVIWSRLMFHVFLNEMTEDGYCHSKLISSCFQHWLNRVTGWTMKMNVRSFNRFRFVLENVRIVLFLIWIREKYDD